MVRIAYGTPQSNHNYYDYSSLFSVYVLFGHYLTFYSNSICDFFSLLSFHCVWFVLFSLFTLSFYLYISSGFVALLWYCFVWIDILAFSLVFCIRFAAMHRPLYFYTILVHAHSRFWNEFSASTKFQFITTTLKLTISLICCCCCFFFMKILHMRYRICISNGKKPTLKSYAIVLVYVYMSLALSLLGGARIYAIFVVVFVIIFYSLSYILNCRLFLFWSRAHARVFSSLLSTF